MSRRLRFRRDPRPPIVPPLVEHDPLRDPSLHFHCLNRGHHTRYFGRQQFSENPHCLVPYHSYSLIGGDAAIETFRLLSAFRALSVDARNASPDNRLPARMVIRAKLAAVFGVAVRRQILDDRELLPRVIEERAVREILQDDFWSAWTGLDVPLLSYAGWGGDGGGDEDGSGGAWGGGWGGSDDRWGGGEAVDPHAADSWGSGNSWGETWPAAA
ncbi:hypothetical protein R3P38DRAFT_3168863 [Favolaschia claudopus]|uniref:Uncharacterized protein n=1 Tax=Favolaschia claudopus TaxID=2862362 RepID=A0AAW0E130_9AGAR